MKILWDWMEAAQATELMPVVRATDLSENHAEASTHTIQSLKHAALGLPRFTPFRVLFFRGKLSSETHSTSFANSRCTRLIFTICSRAMDISVIICTHNPREHYLRRTLDALKNQTLEKVNWELLLVDNASDVQLSQLWNVGWHPHAKLSREDLPGLTHARLKGMSMAIGELLVFVDDDNVLDPDYLNQCLQISRTELDLGAWGGSCIPEYESDPPPWFSRVAAYIGARPVLEDATADVPFRWDAAPIGAGMCLRRCVADAYRASLMVNAQRAGLDRVGDSFGGSGDMDMAYSSCDVGLKYGIRKKLKLTHLMSSNRLEWNYMRRMVRSTHCSERVLKALRGIQTPTPRSFWGSSFLRWIRFLQFSRVERMVRMQAAAGAVDAERVLSGLDLIMASNSMDK